LRSRKRPTKKQEKTAGLHKQEQIYKDARQRHDKAVFYVMGPERIIAVFAGAFTAVKAPGAG